MLYDEEKDYVMRMIREVSRVLFSILFGKQYVQIETELENKFRTEGTPENALKDLVDRGQICEAENILLEDLDYSNKASAAFAVMFYRYLGEMEDGFCSSMIFPGRRCWTGWTASLRIRDIPGLLI